MPQSDRQRLRQQWRSEWAKSWTWANAHGTNRPPAGLTRKQRRANWREEWHAEY